MPAAVARARASIHMPTRVRRAKEASARSRRRRRGSSPAALSSPLEDDDLLWEILLRLPPQPSSLPRASAVCKRWRCAATDPRFHRRFFQHHRKPPLGFFEQRVDGVVFKPVLDPPDRILHQRFDVRFHGIDSGRGTGVKLLGCRHGRLLIIRSLQQEIIVIAPITGKEHRVQVPPEFKSGCYVNGAVLCAAADHNHVHGSCHSSPFKVVLLSMGRYLIGPPIALARVYYSETGIWGDLISTPTPCQLHDTGTHGSLVGNALYWSCDDYIFQFDLEGQSLALIKAPRTINDARDCFDMREVIEIMDGAVGLAILSHYYYNIQMWQMKVNCQGVAKWVLWKTIDMRNIHGIPHGFEGERPELCRLRYDEDTDDIFLHVGTSVYVVQLKSMQSKKLCEAHYVNRYYSFKSFYMPGDCSSLALAL
ncbi:hypothetical protein CFC21_033405 [Triticum aestivum]|uniref:F-box domain-containing protein n=2 Tax=Triticum aestivum TaxID=4565 RepID=A0A9R1JKC9_WHEAT|nr:hypothetical protein CFC21_033405 [Triticum aestivum]